MKTKSIIALLTTAFIGGTFTTAALAEGDHKDKAPHTAGTSLPKDYPLTKCPVSDEGFEHGKPIKVTHEGTDVYLCCKACVKDFNKDPAKYAKMVKDAAAKK